MERGGQASKLRSEQPARGEWLRAEEIQFCTETSPPSQPQLGVPEEGGSHSSDLAEYYGKRGGDLKLEELSRQPQAVAAHWWDPHALLCMRSSETWFGFGFILPLAL